VNNELAIDAQGTFIQESCMFIWISLFCWYV